MFYYKSQIEHKSDQPLFQMLFHIAQFLLALLPGLKMIVSVQTRVILAKHFLIIIVASVFLIRAAIMLSVYLVEY